MKAHFARYAETYFYILLFGSVQFLTAYIAEFKPLASLSAADLAAISVYAMRLHYASVVLQTAIVLLAVMNQARSRNAASPPPVFAPKGPVPPAEPTNGGPTSMWGRIQAHSVDDPAKSNP